jgi:hypothetical protein
MRVDRQLRREEETAMSTIRVKLYRPCGALIGEAEVPDIPGVRFGVLTWDNRAFAQQSEVDATIYREVSMWKLGKHAVTRSPGRWQEEESHVEPDR